MGSQSLGATIISQRFDLIVLGAGSGGYAAARTARDLGANVALVDSGPLGGLCILRGCMPSKTLIATGDLLHQIRSADELAVRVGEPALDYPALQARKRELVQGWADYRIAGIETFPLFRGMARFESPTSLRIGDDLLSAPRFVIATGSVTAPPVLPGLMEAGYIDSDAALDLAEPPRSIVVLGGGYVAAELGQFFHRAGIPVTIVIRGAHLLSGEDDDVGDGLTQYFREEGIPVEAGALMERVSVRDGLKVVHFRQNGVEREVAAHEIFMALGRIPNVNGLQLDAAGVAFHEISGIDVDDELRTSNPDIFAVGDVTGLYALVHVAIQQGEVAARNAITGGHERVDYRLTKTHTIFTDPQVAVVGETERELERAGVPYLKATYPFAEHGKAVALGRTRGFVKMLASPADGTILGAAILGPEASDLIEPLIVAMAFGATVQQYAQIPHLHPTLVEILTYPAEEIAEKLISTAPLAVAQ
ncbi:MAG: FAD-dependent oxidoreductase [Vulcanimicrobiaceae bacterium]|jgi:pyruvate/2-oxoglutarate dehydrogenase complex dihydrolipoamide dehydrogenase (E3) component